MNKKVFKSGNDDLYNAVLSLETIEEMKAFFQDLCTVTELQAMEQRFQVAKYLSQGMNYNEILSKTGSSSATISRVNRCLQYGTGGYNIALKRIDD